jgi:hypothetical protein
VAAAYYRYIGEREKEFIEKQDTVRSLSRVTFFTPDRYDSNEVAQRRLALPRRPVWRIGPIPDSQMPSFDRLPLRVVGPANGHPGGGVECATSHPVHLFAFKKLR